MTLKIEELYVFIAQEPKGEGVPAIQLDHLMYPLFGADQARVGELRQMAQAVADMTGKKLTLARFTQREELEVITPQGRGDQHGNH